MFDAADRAVFLDAFEAKEITVTLDGALAGSFRGILRRKTEFVQAETQEVKILPSLLVPEADLVGIGRSHTLTLGGVAYRMHGEPLPQDSGFALIGLTKR